MFLNTQFSSFQAYGMIILYSFWQRVVMWLSRLMKYECIWHVFLLIDWPKLPVDPICSIFLFCSAVHAEGECRFLSGCFPVWLMRTEPLSIHTGQHAMNKTVVLIEIWGSVIITASWDSSWMTFAIETDALGYSPEICDKTLLLKTRHES